MVKGGINKETFLSFLRCNKLALFIDKFNHLKDVEANTAVSMNVNEILFKDLAYELICASEKGYSDKILRNKRFKTKDGEEIQTDIILKRPEGNILVEVVCSGDTRDGSELIWLAYKYYLLKKTNYKFLTVYLVKVDKGFKKNGALSEGILYVKDVKTKLNQFLPNIPGIIQRIKNYTAQNSLPDKQKGTFCLEPFPCPFKKFCWSDMPNEANTAFEIEGMPAITKFNLFWDETFTFEEIPRKRLDKRQWIQVKQGIRDLPYKKTDKLTEWINQLQINQGIWFLDIGCSYPVLPLNENSSPFALTPFQFSLKYEFPGGTNVTPYDYIAAESEMKDLTRNFISNLTSKLSGNTLAPIVVYDARRIKKCLSNISEWHTEYTTAITELEKRIVDLKEVFTECWYYHPKFKGSRKLEIIAPIIISEISYKNLDIKNRADLSNIFLKSLSSSSKLSAKEKNDLVEFCNTNSNALMCIVKFLRNSIDRN